AIDPINPSIRSIEQRSQQIALPDHLVSKISGLVGLGIVVAPDSVTSILGNLFAVDPSLDISDNLAVFPYFCSHSLDRLARQSCDASLVQIVRGHLHFHPITDGQPS